MGYNAISFSAGEQPTTAKWNILGSNDSSFNDGTGIANGAILSTHLKLTGTQNASVTTGESTTSLTYTDLATTTDSVTVTIGSSGLALVFLYALLQNSQASSISYVAFAVSGANTIAASD